MNITFELLQKISNIYGESFYLLDSKQFQNNYAELLKAFRVIYPNSHIAYSYKTNYTPKLCKVINNNGGLAEVVSDMEYKIARKIGVKPKNIFFNGPYKNPKAIEKLLLEGGTVNIDSTSELQIIEDISKNYPEKKLFVGLRCNFDINDSVTSRFGFDVDGKEFIDAVNLIRQINNVNIIGLHCHYATRSLETWPVRAEEMLKLVKKIFYEPPEFISLGGGLFGKMDPSLKAQFNVKIPSYKDYAEAVATKFGEFYKHMGPSRRPKLIIEPGSALVGDAMKFVTKVVNIKDIRGKKVATLAGSMYNINPTLNKKNLPITIYHDDSNSNKQQIYKDLDFGGYTCIESDYLYRGFTGKLAIGDYIVFDNVGSYSVVLKPPFILPNFPVLDIDGDEVEVIKKAETFDDIFKTYEF